MRILQERKDAISFKAENNAKLYAGCLLHFPSVWIVINDVLCSFTILPND